MAETHSALSGLTVLIIEDEFLIAADVQHVLEEAGAASALLASSTAMAREYLDGGKPVHVALLDLKLGKEDGMPLADELRRRGIPFVVATGQGDFHMAGVVVVQKPYDPNEVVAALLEAVRPNPPSAPG